MKNILFCCTVGFALSGCNADSWGPPLTAFAAVDAVSVINTQKTVDDHIVSLVTGKDCSTVRASQGDHYCVEEPQPVPSLLRTAYCYKTLADVTCYDRPLEQDASQLYGTHIDAIPVTSR